MSSPARSLSPAFYARRRTGTTPLPAWADWWTVLHPPYTLWHLGYVAIGASIAPHFDGGKLTATLLAFFLAVGVCAHALDEWHGRPLRTTIPAWQLLAVASVALSGAVGLGVIGLTRVGPGLLAFIAAGVVLTCGYGLELLGGRLHNDVTFALAWGAFPVLTAYYAQAGTLTVPAAAAAGACYLLSTTQRRLSTPARDLRRRVIDVEGAIVFEDGRRETLTVASLLAPLERALVTTAWSVVWLATGLVAFRLQTA